MSEPTLPAEYQQRLNTLVQKFLPLLKRGLAITSEFNLYKFSCPFRISGYEQLFQMDVYPISENPGPSKSIQHVPTYQEVETKAKSLFVAFYLAMEDGSTKAEVEESWMRTKSRTVDNPCSASAMAYTGWIAAAREALS